MQNEERDFPRFYFFLDLREARLKIIDKEKLGLFLVLLAFSENVCKDESFLILVSVFTLLIKST
jgi:hypothetical protein